MQATIKPVIMAGGSGVRLWPLSDMSHPKQFIKTLDGLSAFQRSLLRHKDLGIPAVIVNTEHSDIAAAQIAEIDIEAQLIIEPYQKNTAPCAVIGALLAKREGYDNVLLIPSDIHVSDNELYFATLERGFEVINQNIVTIGITPTSAHTGYGYIKVGESIANYVHNVEKFVEKPDSIRAEDYLKQGAYFWNSGIFIYDAEYLLKQMHSLHPLSYENICNSFAQATNKGADITLAPESYAKIEAISVDYAIMEHVTNMRLVEGHFGWSDIGSWESLWQLQTKDQLSNYLEGNNVITYNVTNSYIVSNQKISSQKKLVIIGLDNIAVIDTKDAILVANKSCSEEIKWW
ncbi:MAG: sugar phosphate nucleotidyltransferase [Pseudomonadota bacterium]